jgi:hypothetical protein
MGWLPSGEVAGGGSSRERDRRARSAPGSDARTAAAPPNARRSTRARLTSISGPITDELATGVATRSPTLGGSAVGRRRASPETAAPPDAAAGAEVTEHGDDGVVHGPDTPADAPEEETAAYPTLCVEGCCVPGEPSGVWVLCEASAAPHWLHSECEGLTEEDLTDTADSYLCSLCIRPEERRRVSTGQGTPGTSKSKRPCTRYCSGCRWVTGARRAWAPCQIPSGSELSNSS